MRAVLTREGKKRHAAAARALNAAEQEAFGHLTAGKKDELLGLVRALKGGS